MLGEPAYLPSSDIEVGSKPCVLDLVGAILVMLALNISVVRRSFVKKGFREPYIININTMQNALLVLS